MVVVEGSGVGGGSGSGEGGMPRTILHHCV